ncbi:hypothetical protein CKAH01_12851 [Colletotrichum kahawae]|uniref:Uncharacterized protein n=1 Tax=Colletotrichum kahawae TaxID=34407 RepID=A0AAE0DC52_COLKA|nr:hypothetical protein CKAH01_12851 [Colletotrichum kahawae]
MGAADMTSTPTLRWWGIRTSGKLSLRFRVWSGGTTNPPTRDRWGLREDTRVGWDLAKGTDGKTLASTHHVLFCAVSAVLPPSIIDLESAVLGRRLEQQLSESQRQWEVVRERGSGNLCNGVHAFDDPNRPETARLRLVDQLDVNSSEPTGSIRYSIRWPQQKQAGCTGSQAGEPCFRLAGGTGKGANTTRGWDSRLQRGRVAADGTNLAQQGDSG